MWQKLKIETLKRWKKNKPWLTVIKLTQLHEATEAELPKWEMEIILVPRYYINGSIPFINLIA